MKKEDGERIEYDNEWIIHNELELRSEQWELRRKLKSDDKKSREEEIECENAIDNEIKR